MSSFPFSAVVGADDLSLALILSAIAPEVGGVLVRGEKGTAKSTIVRAMPDILPPIKVVAGCRYSCDPDQVDPNCPDGPHTDVETRTRQVRLVELPVGASDDRVTGSMDIAKALGAGHATFHPGLLAEANRGILYVDEVNLLHDHLVDVLLDAAAMGRNSVERDGMSVTHPARFVLIGTMNPEEGELRPQLLDRFGLSVDVAASRDPQVRAEVVQRRLAFDADPAAFVAQYRDAEDALRQRVATAKELLADVDLSAWALRTIARVCAGFNVDGMRADIVIARTSAAHAAWRGARSIAREDIRAAAVFALTHRQRRGPFDPPGLDEELLDRLLDEEPEPPQDPQDPDDGPDGSGDSDRPDGSEGSGAPESRDSGSGPQSPPPTQDNSSDDATDASNQPGSHDPNHDQSSQDSTDQDDQADAPAPASVGVAAPGSAFRTQTFTVKGVGSGSTGRRSDSEGAHGRIVGVAGERTSRVHLVETIRQAARTGRFDSIAERLVVSERHVRYARLRGKESNLVLFCVDASGSMAARKRMQEVKTAVLSLLVDAYERRDKVGLVTFSGTEAALLLPPTSSIDLAANALSTMPHGGRTPLAEGLTLTATVLGRERRRDPQRRPLVVIVTDGRATAGKDALKKAQAIADRWAYTGVETVVVDCESGRFRMHLARDLASRMGATHVELEEVSANGLVTAVHNARKAA